MRNINFFVSPFRSIKYKYLIFTFISFALFLSSYTYFWYSKTSDESEKASTQYITELLYRSNENFELAMNDVNILLNAAETESKVRDLLLADYSTDFQYQKNNEEMQQYLIYLFGYRSNINGMTITHKFRPDSPLTTYPDFTFGLTTPVDDMKKSDWYNDIINSGEDTLFILPHNTDINAKKNPPGIYTNMVMSVAKNLFYGNTYLGTIITDVRCKYLLDYFQVNLGEQSTVFVYDGKSGEFVLRPPQENLLPDFNETEFKENIRTLKDTNGNTRVKLGGQDFLIVYYKSEMTGWTTVGLIPREKLMENFEKTKNTTLIAASLFFAASILFSHLIALFLTKNLLTLNKAIKSVNKNNLDISIKFISNDEVGQLYHQFNAMVLRIKQLVSDIRNSEREKRKAEIYALQSQINPHFLNNTLNTIKILAVLHGSDSIKTVSEALSTLLHVYMNGKRFISISDEIKYIESYLSIQEYKYSDKFSWDIYVEKGLGGNMLPKLLLQPLVENALMHGIAPLNNKGVLSIKIYSEYTSLKIRVQDNGVGMSEEKIDNLLNNRMNPENIGVQNVISRLKLYYGDLCCISIMSQENMYTVFELSIPLVSEEEVDPNA